VLCKHLTRADLVEQAAAKIVEHGGEEVQRRRVRIPQADSRLAQRHARLAQARAVDE